MKRTLSPALQTAIGAHRQVERYLFRFARDSTTGEFIATNECKLPATVMTRPGVVGDWSMKDLLASLVVWDESLLAWHTRGRGRKGLTVPRPGETDVPDPQLFREIRRRSLDKVLELFQRSHRRVVRALQQKAGQGALGEFVALTLAARYDRAKGHIRKWVRHRGSGTLSKPQLLHAIQRERTRLEEILAGVRPDQITRPGVAGEWSLKDILAHLFDWEQRFLGWYEAGLRGEVPHTPAPGFSWRDLPGLNQGIFEKYRRWSLPRVRRAFDQSYLQTLAAVRVMREEDLFTPGRYAWTGKATLAGYVAANTAHHYRWAYRKIRAWMKTRRMSRPGRRELRVTSH